MDSTILQSIIDITQHRDTESLEYNLLATLAELVPSTSISIYKKSDDDNTDIIEEVVRLDTNKTSNDTKFQWTYDPRSIEINEHLKKCLDTQKIVLFDEPGDTKILLVPITLNGETGGALHLTGKSGISSSIELIKGFVKIYENYLSILNESERDKLTNLFNRRTFEKKLTRLLETQKEKQQKSSDEISNNKRRSTKDNHQAWLVILDIDHFKRVNDKFGHVYGDEVLLILSQLMKKSFRCTDLLFRFGGEEFVIILEPIPLNDTTLILDRFRKTVSEHIFSQVGNITISIGYARIGEQDYPPVILENADKALYYAKEHGRNAAYNYEKLIKEGKLEKTVKSGDVDLF